jgi:lysozyme
MTTAYLISDLKRDEGLRSEAYPDPLSGGDPWTIGYGHTGPEVHAGLIWNEEQCESALLEDIVEHEEGLDTEIPWWRGLDDLRQDVLSNMAFNLGVGGLLGFPAMLAATQAGDYATAADEMLDSQWADQVGQRAIRLSDQMRTGVHQD